MGYKDCEKRSDDGNTHPQCTRRRTRVAICERCRPAILTLPGIAVGTDGTLARLERFGLAITGEPLLELKREGI